MTEVGKQGPPHEGAVGKGIETAPDSRGSWEDDGALVRLERALSAELARLEDEFAEALSDDVVIEEFSSCVRSFASARIRLYVPVLSYRNARRALRAKARAVDVGRDDDLPGAASEATRAAERSSRRGVRARRR